MKNNSSSNSKIIKLLPKTWNNRNKAFSEMVYGDKEFVIYCNKLYESLTGIKKFYENDFNKDNVCTIDEYLGFFNNLYNKFLNISIDDKSIIDDYFKSCKNLKIDINSRARFNIFDKIKYRNNKIYKLNNKHEVTGFTEYGYDEISKIAKQLFMIEKLCSFTTKKFWKNELTDIKDLDLNSKFEILVKCVFSVHWRSDNNSTELKNYYKERIYSSASLIDENHKENLFALPKTDIFAILILDGKEEDIVCASKTDSYSEEYIDNKNLLEYKQEYTNVLLQDQTHVGGKGHKLYAEAVECETPKNLLQNLKRYTEVNLKNAKTVGVICPNSKSITFSKNQAGKYKVPLFVFE